MIQPSAAIATILFTDVVGSTELLQRVGDEQGQRIFIEYHKLLSAASGFHGGFRFEVEWRVAQLEEAAALDALAQALDARVLRATEIGANARAARLAQEMRG